MSATRSFRSDVERAAWTKAKSMTEVHWDGLVKAGVAPNMAKQYVRRWAKLGYIVQNAKQGHRKTYHHAGAKPVVVEETATCKTPEDAMWVVMTRHRMFSVVDLAAIGSVGTIEVNEKQAQRYCDVLLRSGYLRVRQTAVTGKRPAIYQLINKTGMRAPVVRRLSGLFDPNQGSFKPFAEDVNA